MGNRAVLARTVRHALVLLHLREVALLALEVRVGRGQLRAAAAVPVVMMVPLLLLLLLMLFVQLLLLMLLLVTPGLVVVVPGGGGRRGHGRRGQRGRRRRRLLSLTGDAAVHDDHECGRVGREVFANSMMMV